VINFCGLIFNKISVIADIKELQEHWFLKQKACKSKDLRAFKVFWILCMSG
jgi:hypothetical protein